MRKLKRVQECTLTSEIHITKLNLSCLATFLNQLSNQIYLEFSEVFQKI